MSEYGRVLSSKQQNPQKNTKNEKITQLQNPRARHGRGRTDLMPGTEN